jgi:hypothetical protein
MQKAMRITALLVTLAAALLLPAGLASGHVGPEALQRCREFAFSTEEDFVTHGPEPPDGNPIISDGDLLGTNCVVCARNLDLVGGFDVNSDLGLDAVDVLDVDKYVVAFSTELDSPNRGQFTAGDLLVTNGAIIPNVALTHLFGIGYDIGLDGVQFIGTGEDILSFLDYARQVSRDDWLRSPANLAPQLEEFEVDIWFSIEGTWERAVEPGLVLDGDLLSAATGTIVAGSGDLLPSSVPAGIPMRGVDFGLDAVASGRTGDKEHIVFSTEILYEDRVSFTDGDVLQYGNGVVLTNEELIRCFEPKALFVGLDALYAPIGEPLPDCAAVIVQVGGMATGAINPSGYANGLSVDLTFSAHDSPFGRWVKILGLLPSCEKCTKFKMEYGQWADSTTPPTAFYAITPIFDEWIVVTPWLESLVHREADANGWYDILCHPKAGGLLVPWNTSGMNGKYSLRLTVQDAGGGEHVSVPEVVVLDNMVPTAELSLDVVPTCGDITIGSTVTGVITGTDENFYGWRLRYESSAASGVLDQRTYTGPTDTGDAGVPFSWTTTALSECGYRLVLEVWDRTIVDNHRSYGDPGFGWRTIDQDYFCLEAQ